MNVTFPYLLILSSYAMECHCVPYLTCRCLSPLSSLYALWEEGDYTINICLLIFLFPLYRTEQNAFRIVVEEKVFVEINWDTQEFCELDKLLLAWNQPQWEYLHHGNQQSFQITVFCLEIQFYQHTAGCVSLTPSRLWTPSDSSLLQCLFCDRKAICWISE